MAPTIYITGNPSRTDARSRATSVARSGSSPPSIPTPRQTDTLSVALADPVGMKALHMVTADPQRTPTLVMFAHPDYFLFAGAPNCTSPCITVPTTPPTSDVRVEPRRHPAGDRDDLARHRRPRRASPR